MGKITTTEQRRNDILKSANRVLNKFLTMVEKNGGQHGRAECGELEDGGIYFMVEHNLGDQSVWWLAELDKLAWTKELRYDYNNGVYDWKSKVYFPENCFVRAKF